MSRVLAALERHATEDPDRIVFESGDAQFSACQLRNAVATLSESLHESDVRVLALAADNSPAWAIADLACVRAGITLIPIPHFFSPQQIGHLLHKGGVDGIITDRAGSISDLLSALNIEQIRPLALNDTLSLIRIETADASLPPDCAKITFTSGSTGEPKGVCLSQTAMECVAASLADATDASMQDRHLSLLPYATLLENIGGIYAPLLAGATIIAPGMAEIGMSGAAGLDVAQFVKTIHLSRATTCIMIPQMLQALVAAVGPGANAPEALRYIAVGGAPVSEHLLAAAETLALPVYEGYGLSEAASVVAVNRIGDCKPGSVGRPLQHVQLEFAEDGEILVNGALFAGYLGEAPRQPDLSWPTGDIGYLDADGYLFLSGRKKHIFITAFGRNVSPEWVERELAIEPAIAQCCVFGEAQPFNVALIVARNNADAEAVQQAVESANARLPDYARVSRWIAADEPFSVANGLWTGTGRPRRGQIFETYAERIRSLY